MPWARAEVWVLNAKTDALLGAYYKKDKRLLYPRWHISIEDPLVVIFNKTVINNWNDTHIKSLKDKKVGWIRGYGFEKTLLKNIHIDKKEVSRMQSGLLMLKVGRLDAFIDYAYNIEPLGQKIGLQMKEIFTTKIINKGSKLFLAFSNSKRSKKLIKIFDERMDKLVETGEIEKIYLKWGHHKSKFGKNRYDKN